MTAFANSYLDVFSRGFHYAFMAAIVAMLVSLVIYLANKSKFPDPGKKVVEAASAKTVTKEEVQMSATEIRQRIYACSPYSVWLSSSGCLSTRTVIH